MTNADCVPNGFRSVEYDRLFEALADRHRRLLLYRLAEAEVATVDELVDALSDRVAADPARLEISLTHTHLPKMDEAAIVDYDRRSSTVRYRGSGTRLLEDVLERTAAVDLADE